MSPDVTQLSLTGQWTVHSMPRLTFEKSVGKIYSEIIFRGYCQKNFLIYSHEVWNFPKSSHKSL